MGRQMNWKSIKGYEGKYEVSDTGLIRNSKGGLIGQYQNHNGYMMARLSNPRKEIRVHRIVAESFIENKYGKPFVNHIDCVRSNNTVANLEWCSQWENLNHSQHLGRMQRDYWIGKRSPSATLTDETAEQIRVEYKKGGVSWESLAKKFGTNKRTVGRIISGESYV